MNFKFAVFLLFVGASSASFIASTNGNVGVKASFETISSPILKAVQKKVAEKDVIDDLLAVLAQILSEFELFGDVITATLLEDLQNLLADLDVIGGDLLAQVIAILETYIDQLPQVVIDILVELGLLPPTGVSKQDEIIDDLLAILAQILSEFELFGEVITATLLEDLQSLLADLEIIGGDLLAEVVAILASYIDQLPQVVIDILTQLGLLPKVKAQVKLVILTLEKALYAKDIWTDLVDALMLQLVQILADLESWGINVSDDVLAQIENFILAVMAEGGQAWEVLQSLLEQYAVELQEVLGELLAQIGILPKTSAAIKDIQVTKDIIDDILNTLAGILAELDQFGSIISQELIDTFTGLLLDLQGVSDEAFQLVVALLEQYAELLYEQFGDLLEQLGITVPPLVTPAASELMVAKDIIDDIFQVLDQILAEIDLIGSVVSDELIQSLSELVLELEQVGGVAFEMIVALLTEYAELLADQFGDLLAQLGITLPPTGTEAPAF